MKAMTRPSGATLCAARNLVAILMVSAAVSATSAAAAPKPAKSKVIGGGDAAVQAGKLWQRLLTKCPGGIYGYAGSGWDLEAETLIPEKPGLHSTLYKGVRFTDVKVPITRAQALNGVQERHRIAMISAVYKDADDDIWKDGPASNPVNMNDIFWKVIRSGLSDTGRMGTGGSLVFDLVRFEGKWAVGRSSVNLSGPVGTGNYYTLEGVLAAPTPHVDCATGAAKY